MARTLHRKLAGSWTAVVVAATFVDAGHIMGSAIIGVSVSDHDGDEATRIVFSGDLGRRDTPIIRDPTIVTDADYVLMESTYGGREHEPGAEGRRERARHHRDASHGSWCSSTRRFCARPAPVVFGAIGFAGP